MSGVGAYPAGGSNPQWDQTRAKRRGDQPTVANRMANEFKALGNNQIYTVQAGDTFYDMAKAIQINNDRFDNLSTMELATRIQHETGVANPRRLQIGTRVDLNAYLDDQPPADEKPANEKPARENPGLTREETRMDALDNALGGDQTDPPVDDDPDCSDPPVSSEQPGLTTEEQRMNELDALESPEPETWEPDWTYAGSDSGNTNPFQWPRLSESFLSGNSQTYTA